MKKFLAIIFLSLLVTVLAVGPASAQRGKININGQVESFDEVAETLTVETKKGETFDVLVEGFDFTTVAEGDAVLIKAHKDGEQIVADTIKLIGAGKDGDEVELEEPDLSEGSKDNSAYCGGDKQEKSHPLALKIAERYDMTEEDFMGYFCEGYSIGAVMLALKTSQIDGIGDPIALLALRAEGEPWGHIWKDAGMIGKDKTWDTPPGHLKRPDHAGGEDLD